MLWFHIRLFVPNNNREGVAWSAALSHTIICPNICLIFTIPCQIHPAEVLQWPWERADQEVSATRCYIVVQTWHAVFPARILHVFFFSLFFQARTARWRRWSLSIFVFQLKSRLVAQVSVSSRESPLWNPYCRETILCLQDEIVHKHNVFLTICLGLWSSTILSLVITR